MKTGIFLSYKGLGANLLHLSYCHEIAKKFGPITLITLNPKLIEVLSDDPNIKEIIYLDDYHKRFLDVLKLSSFLKRLELDNLFIFYPSLRYFISAKIAGIKKIYNYPLLSKKNLHLVKAAKKFTEKCLNLENCPTETKILVDKEKIKKLKKNSNNILLGIGSSGLTTKWGYKNYIKLIKKLNESKKFYFYLLCGPNENDDAENIIKEVGNYCSESLSNKNISEVKDYISLCDLYIGNDSFGHHISSQMGKPSFIILLDTPRAYSDYSVNQNRILPPNVNIDEITHDSKFDPNLITTDMVINKIKKFI